MPATNHAMTIQRRAESDFASLERIIEEMGLTPSDFGSSYPPKFSMSSSLMVAAAPRTKLVFGYGLHDPWTDQVSVVAQLSYPGEDGEDANRVAVSYRARDDSYGYVYQANSQSLASARLFLGVARDLELPHRSFEGISRGVAHTIVRRFARYFLVQLRPLKAA